MVEDSSSAVQIKATDPGGDGAALIEAPPAASLLPAAQQLPDNIPACCVATIRKHVRHNPMMVCAECKNIIKCFDEERAYQNYVKFCQSRRRPILIGRIDEYMTVAFRSYDTYNR
jgi:hypothetical protein